LQVGELAWITQVYYGPGSTGLMIFTFFIPVWEGEITLEGDEKGSHLRQAAFVPYEEACSKIIPSNAVALRRWLAAPHEEPHIIYWNYPDDDPKILSTRP
jgi:hypothetical protein